MPSWRQKEARWTGRGPWGRVGEGGDEERSVGQNQQECRKL